MDEGLEDLRARVARGDESARAPWRRALLRAGRPVTDAWAGLPLALAPGLAGRLLEVHDLLADLDPRRVLALVRREGADVHLADTPAGPLVAARPARADGDVLLDLARRPRASCARRMGRWRDGFLERRLSLPLRVPLSRTFDLAARVFARLGEPLEVDRRERVPGPGAFETTVRLACGARSVRAIEHRDEDLWAGDEVWERGEVDGLPGGVTLDHEHHGVEWTLDGPEAAVGRVERALREVLEEVVAAEVPLVVDPVEPPDAALAARGVPALGETVLLSPAQGGHDELLLLVGSPRDGVRAAVRLHEGWLADAPGARAGCARTPAGPLPVALHRAHRGFAGPPGGVETVFDLLLEALAERAASSAVEEQRASRSGRTSVRRRLGDWTELVVDVRPVSAPPDAPVVGRELRLHHARGLRPSLFARARRGGTVASLDLALVGDAPDVEQALQALRARLLGAAWREH